MKVRFFVGSICKLKCFIPERIKCDKQKFRRHHIENECRSVDRIKIAECNGYCGGEQVNRNLHVILILK